MRRTALACLIAVASPLAARAAGAAGPAHPAVSIIWVRPDRLSPARRAALARVLEDAVEGRTLHGVLVKDSRPRVEGGAVKSCPGSPVYSHKAGLPARR